MAYSYNLDDAGREAAKQYVAEWKAIAFRTGIMSPAERERAIDAAIRLYEVSGLTPPPRHRIVIAPSPMVARFAAGAACAIWYARKKGGANATSAATYAATDAATRAATDAATYAATSAATAAATAAATNAATNAATRDATNAATRDATDAATRDATNDPLATFFLRCVGMSYRMRNGGNQWAGWCSYLSFFARVAKLGLPQFRAWRHYESAAIHGGPRYVHKRFWIVSDFPQTIGRDEQNRPHCLTGPQLSWRDGWKTYYVHGVRVPAWVVENPERITVASIEAEQNAEIRRVMVERYGIQRYVRDAQFDVLDTDKDPLGQPRRLLRRGDVVVVELTNSTVDADGTRRVYHVPCEPELRPMPRMPGGEWGAPQTLTALNAVASTYSMRGEDYRLAVET